MKVTLTFRGREVYHPELGKKILDQVEEAVKDVGRVEIFPRIDGRNMTMVLAPDKRAQAASAEGSGRSGRRRPPTGRRRRHRRRPPRRAPAEADDRRRDAPRRDDEASRGAAEA